MKIIQTKAKILSLRALGKDIYYLEFYAPRIAKEAKPGQFVNILCGENQSYILRRPFSIYSRTDSSIAILFKVVGKGTSWLKQVKSDYALDLIGPLGNGFTGLKGLKRVLLVSGGIGAAGLRFLAEELEAQGVSVFVALGAYSRDHLPFRYEFKEVADKVYLTTEDGTLGKRGLITDFLTDLYREIKPQVVYACGPYLMLKKVAEFSSLFETPCQVSMEKFMGCGLGVCLSCVCAVRTTTGWEYQRVCMEGPVFNSDEVLWDET